MGGLRELHLFNTFSGDALDFPFSNETRKLKKSKKCWLEKFCSKPSKVCVGSRLFDAMNGVQISSEAIYRGASKFPYDDNRIPDLD